MDLSHALNLPEKLNYMLNTVFITACPLFLCRILGLFLTVRPGKRYKLLLYLGSLVLIAMTIFIGDLANLPPTLLIYLFCVYISCRESGHQKVAIVLLTATIALSFNTLMDNFLLYSGDIFMDGYLKFIFWFIVYLFFRRRAPEKDISLSPSMWKLIIVLSMTPLGIVLTLVLLSSSNYSVYEESSILAYPALLLIALFSIISILNAITVLTRQQKLEEQLRLADMNRHYYEQLAAGQSEIRRLKHDMSNHLQTLLALPDPQKNAYIQELADSPGLSRRLQYCPDPTINAVLNTKLSQMEKEQISCQPRLALSAPLPFDPVDICALFANALDNAMEACLKLPEKNRRISIHCQMQKGLFVLRLINTAPASDLPETASESPSFPGLSRFTTKTDKKQHGYGLQSIREIVQRLGGRMEFHVENGEAALFLYLPCPPVASNDSKA